MGAGGPIRTPSKVGCRPRALSSKRYRGDRKRACAQAAKAATATVPIVFANGSDPVRIGLVVSMNRPGGNATGVSFYTSALGPKRLELLHELVPKAESIAFLVNPTNPVTEGDFREMEAAARSVGQRTFVVNASSEKEIDAAFA